MSRRFHLDWDEEGLSVWCDECHGEDRCNAWGKRGG